MSEAPFLRVVRGDPSAEELAAVVAVLASRGGSVSAPPATRSLWAVPQLRHPLVAGPDAWRAFALPR